MNKNRKKFEKFVEELKNQENIDIYDVEYLEEYWGDEKDKRMHFRIKGLKNWLWGVWLVDTEDNQYGYELHVFCQYDRFVDKFKPGRGDFNIKIAPGYEYNDNGEKYLSLDLWELGRAINFMKEHEAMAFCYGDDITKYNGELWAKWYMFKTIARDIWYDWSQERIQKKLHRWAAIFSYIKCIKVIFTPDELNEGEHINDEWFVYPCNKFGKWIAISMNKMIKKRLSLGVLFVEESEEDMMWDAYSRSLCRHKYELKKITENEDGTINVDDNELWATINQMDCDEVIAVYGEI